MSLGCRIRIQYVRRWFAWRKGQRSGNLIPLSPAGDLGFEPSSDDASLGPKSYEIRLREVQGSSYQTLRNPGSKPGDQRPFFVPDEICSPSGEPVDAPCRRAMPNRILESCCLVV